MNDGYYNPDGYRCLLSPHTIKKLPLDPDDLYDPDGQGEGTGALLKLPKKELEIGFGNGEYTVKRAAANPDTLLIGLEVSFPCVARCARRIRQAGLENLKILCADARFMMRELFADEALDRISMNFPCPWPKTRHAKRRVTARDFTDGLAAVLKRGGAFELVTDEEWYAAEVRDALEKHGALRVADCETNVRRSITTKYERKWLEMGKSIFRLTAEKVRAFTTDRRTWDFFKEGDGGVTMHVRTGKPLPERGKLAALLDAPGADGDARWAFKSHYAAEDGRKFLIETVSTDDEFEQRYYLKAAERDGGALVKLDGTARVFLTPSVRFAVEDLARRLSEASNGTAAS